MGDERCDVDLDRLADHRYRASSRVSPWLVQPGRAGTATLKPPSASGVSTTSYSREVDIGSAYPPGAADCGCRAREIKPPPRISGHSGARVPETAHIAAYPRVFVIGAFRARPREAPANSHFHLMRLLGIGLIAMQKGRALHPDLEEGVGLCPLLAQLRRAHPSPGILPALLQPAQAPWLSRGPTADQPRSQRPWVGHRFHL